MGETIFGICIGIAFVVIGILNRKGNISMMHSYHRKRVSEEDKIPFGKLVGNGTITIGLTLVFYGIILIVHDLSKIDILKTIGLIVLICGFSIGLIIIFYALKKYNKGIF